MSWHKGHWYLASRHRKFIVCQMLLLFFQPCKFFPTVWSIWNSRVVNDYWGVFGYKPGNPFLRKETTAKDYFLELIGWNTLYVLVLTKCIKLLLSPFLIVIINYGWNPIITIHKIIFEGDRKYPFLLHVGPWLVVRPLFTPSSPPYDRSFFSFTFSLFLNRRPREERKLLRTMGLLKV